MQQNGEVLIYKNDQLLSTRFTTVPVSDAGGDLGLLGIAFDPDFNNNKYVYFYYTNTNGRNTVGRYNASNDTVSGGPTTIYTTPASFDYHGGGTIAFGTDGKIYLTTGDSGFPFHAQDLGSIHGKVLRINKDGTVPSDNPFVSQSGALPEVWAYGFRNPFRGQFDNTTGRFYLGDVGEKTWEEINLITKGANYGWPDCEGACPTTGVTNPVYSYSHNDESASVTGGFVYHGNMFPSTYSGRYIFADYAAGFIKTLTLDDAGGLVSDQYFESESYISRETLLKEAPDGSVYFVTIYPARLFRISYSVSNLLPVAKAVADVTSGDEPLTVKFSSDGSNDPEGLPLTYSWDFDDDTTSTEPNPEKTFTNPGTYSVLLTVSDGNSQAQATPINIQVGTPPVINVVSPLADSTYSAGENIEYLASASDESGNPLGASNFNTEIVFHHDTHIHPAFGPQTGVNSGDFLVPSNNETATNVWYEFIFTATDTNGLSATKSVNVYPKVVILSFVTDPPNLKLFVDSQDVTAPINIDSVVGMERELMVPAMQLLNGTYYQFDTWSDGKNQNHTVNTPDIDSVYTAKFKTTPPFSATYYNNINLSGNPVLTRNEGMIDYDFGAGSPGSGVNTNNFSARFVKQHYFSANPYKFDVLSDDGVRLYLDGTLIIDKWIDQASTPYSNTVQVTEGNHELKLEYYEKSGNAIIKLNWDQVSGTAPPVPTPTPSGQSVTSFSLINADSDSVINSQDPLVNNSTLDLSLLPTKNLNIRANTNPATVGSVKFAYDTNLNYGTENTPPYALASDSGGNYIAWTPPLGSHTISATPYQDTGASGTAGSPLTINLNVIESVAPTPTPTPTPSGQTITSFTLINADTDQVIAAFNPIPANTTLNLATLPSRNLNIRANTNPATVGSVRFAYDGNLNFGTENTAPYALASDSGGNYTSWTPTLGPHSVTATPYTGQSAGGSAGTSLTLNFTVTDSGPPSPTPTPQAIQSFSLINADTNQVIAIFDPMQNNAILDFSNLGTRNLNIRANTNPATVGSVRFELDTNTNFNYENFAPYALASDSDGDYVLWTPSIGSHTVKAIPYSSSNLVGNVGTPLSITFNVSE